jgi:hypothetical protein
MIRDQISYEQAKDNLISEKQPSKQFVQAEHIGKHYKYI